MPSEPITGSSLRVSQVTASGPGWVLEGEPRLTSSLPHRSRTPSKDIFDFDLSSNPSPGPSSPAWTGNIKAPRVSRCPQTRHVGCLTMTLGSYTPSLPLGLGLKLMEPLSSPPALTDSTSLGPEPLPSPPATPATHPAEVADTPEPPEHPDRVSSGAQRGGVCGSGCRLFSNCLWPFQSPVPGCRKSKGMKCT